MYSRPFMKNQGLFTLLLDSNSLDRKLPTMARRSRALFEYSETKFLNFVRSPETVTSDVLQQIPTFKRKTKQDALSSFEIPWQNEQAKYAFTYRNEDVEKIGKLIFKKKTLDDIEKRLTELVFIQATLNRSNGYNMLITENVVLLKNRYWLESHFPGGILNIMPIQEAVEIVDLIFKYNGKFPVGSHFFLNKGYWYWISFRTKIPYYHVSPNTVLDAFAQRFVFMLMSVDEIGFQYFSGSNNDTMDNMIYHFNYFISLVGGIFDSLALHTFSHYSLSFKGSHIPQRISLHNKVGKDFLKAVREKNSDLRNHINEFVHFIKAVYSLRELVIHKEGLKKLRFSHSDKWQANFIEVPKDFVTFIENHGDEKNEFKPWSKFGIYKEHIGTFLEPYTFTKTGLLELSSFCNKFLKLLGFGNFVDNIKKTKPNDDFVKAMKRFEESNLGL